MATGKQIIAAKKILENPGRPVKEIMEEVGYSPNTAHNPKDLTTSKGFRELMTDVGLTEELVATALVDDIRNKPGKRTSELTLAARILGMDAGETPAGANPIVAILNVYGIKRDGRPTYQPRTVVAEHQAAQG